MPPHWHWVYVLFAKHFKLDGDKYLQVIAGRDNIDTIYEYYLLNTYTLHKESRPVQILAKLKIEVALFLKWIGTSN